LYPGITRRSSAGDVDDDREDHQIAREPVARKQPEQDRRDHVEPDFDHQRPVNAGDEIHRNSPDHSDVGVSVSDGRKFGQNWRRVSANGESDQFSRKNVSTAETISAGQMRTDLRIAKSRTDRDDSSVIAMTKPEMMKNSSTPMYPYLKISVLLNVSP
jgi:hypothetical protein